MTCSRVAMMVSVPRDPHGVQGVFDDVGQRSGNQRAIDVDRR
jgi:hypothetical protein